MLDSACFKEDGGPSIAEPINKVLIQPRLRPFHAADNSRVPKRGPMGGWDQLRSRLVGQDGKPMIYCFSTHADRATLYSYGSVGAGLHRGPAAAVPRLLLRLYRTPVACCALVAARVSDAVIAELRGREREGIIELPKAPGLKPGDHLPVITGPFSERLALYEGQTSHERVAVLLQFLRGRHRTELPANAIEPKEAVS